MPSWNPCTVRFQTVFRTLTLRSLDKPCINNQKILFKPEISLLFRHKHTRNFATTLKRPPIRKKQDDGSKKKEKEEKMGAVNENNDNDNDIDNNEEDMEYEMSDMDNDNIENEWKKDSETEWSVEYDEFDDDYNYDEQRGVYYDDQGVGYLKSGQLSSPDMQNRPKWEKFLEHPFAYMFKRNNNNDNNENDNEMENEQMGNEIPHPSSVNDNNSNNNNNRNENDNNSNRNPNTFEMYSIGDAIRLELYSIISAVIILVIVITGNFHEKEYDDNDPHNIVNNSINKQLMDQMVTKTIEKEKDLYNNVLTINEINQINDPIEKEKELQKYKLLQAKQLENMKNHELADAFKILWQERIAMLDATQETSNQT